MKNILLIGDVNVRATIATLRALNDKNLKIYLCFKNRKFINYLIYRSYFQNTPLYYNSNSEEEFVCSLINIKKQVGNFTLLPYGESLLRWALKHKDILLSNGILIPTVDINRYKLISNKKSFVDLCNKFEIKTPPENNTLDFNSGYLERFVIKPKSQILSKRVLKYPMLIENEQSFQKLKNLDLDLSQHFIQKYVYGPSFYYCTYYDNGIKKISFVQKNILQQPAGKSVVKAIPYDLPKELIYKIDKMLYSINWDGVIMIEVKQDLKSGEFYAIEANPRFWGPLQLSIDNGINFPAYLLGIEKETNIKNKCKYGYFWHSGYILGLPIKWKTKTKFQKYEYKKKQGIIFRDVWLRKDTLYYFVLEPVYETISNIYSRFKDVG